MTTKNQHVDLHGRAWSLDELDADERRQLAELEEYARRHPDWNGYENHWMKTIAAFYAPRGLSRADIVRRPLFRITQDIGSRLAVAAGEARAPDYRDELEKLIRDGFPTRRQFCEATGLSEDMVSHVLARRKHLAIDTLADALQRIGYRLHIAPIAGTEREPVSTSPA